MRKATLLLVATLFNVKVPIDTFGHSIEVINTKMTFRKLKK